jgi:hypothetical protein
MDGYEVWAYLPPTQIDNVAELYCNFKTEYDERQKDCPTCGESDCTDKIDNDGDGKTDETICSPAELDAILEGDTAATPPIAPLRNPTGQNPLYIDHVYGLAAAPRVGEIRTKVNPGCTADNGPDPGEFCDREWSTVLFIGEGAGGESYYALDVTHPYGLDRSSLQDPLTDPTTDYQGDEDPCYGFAANCGILQPTSGTTADAPFRVLWRIGPDTDNNGTPKQCPDADPTCFEGLGESWSTVPVGLIEDPAASGTTQRRETFAIAFGSYHRDPEVERCAPEPCLGPKADNRYWIVRAEDGVLIQASNSFANGETSAAGFVSDGGKAYVESITAAPPGDLSLSYDTKAECEVALGDTCPTPTDNTDRAKPKIPNSTLPDVIMMETEFPMGIAPRFYPDGVVTHVFQADLHGRLWAANISGTDPAWNLSNWTSTWRQWRLFDPLDAPSADIGIDNGTLVSVSDGGYWKASEGKPTVIGSQPIHYTPAIGHFTLNRYAVAFSTGGWAETHPNVTGERFAPFLVLFITDQHLGDPGSCGEADCTDGIDNDLDGSTDESGRDPDTYGICQAWVKRVDEIIIYDAAEDGCGESDCTNGEDDDNDGLIDEGISTNNTVSRVARVTGSPLLVIRQSQGDDPSTPDVNEANLPTTGTAIFTVYDPEQIEVESGLCVGTSYAILVDFHHDGSFGDCTVAGTAVAQAISIGVGFRTLTAGPTSPIMAASGIGSDSQATLGAGPESPWPTAGPEITVLSWQELSCDY